jgi:DNA-binding transcriptional LysR family regulator
MDDANDYVALHAVLTYGGFSAASRELGVPKGTLSKRVVRLEEALGVRLLERSTRHVRATEVGREILEHAELIVGGLEAAAAVAAGAHAEPNGLIRVSTPQGLIHGLLTDILPAFLERYPKVRVNLLEVNRPVNLLQDHIDLALRARLEVAAESSQVVRRLARESALLAASPAVASNLDPGLTIDDLTQLPVISMADVKDWELISRSGEQRKIGITPRLISGNVELLRNAAARGLGIALLPEHNCLDDFKSGRLTQVFPDWSSGCGTIYAVFSSRRGLNPAVRALIDFLAEAVPRFTTPL